VSFKEITLLEMEGWGIYEERYVSETDFLAVRFSILHLYSEETP
jgi:hypothetical protein